MLLLGLADGEVHGYDVQGNFIIKVPMICIDNVAIETALSSSSVVNIVHDCRFQKI